MDTNTVDTWMRAYVKAWETNDPDDIAALFTEEARYFTAPHREPWVGRDGIVEGWLDRKDQQGEWDFRYEILTITDDLAYVRGWTIYHDQATPSYSNLWVLRFAEDGRCSEFTEWWMEGQED
jgi:uncharacterized protein (TIGR02246 family)